MILEIEKQGFRKAWRGRWDRRHEAATRSSCIWLPPSRVLPWSTVQAMVVILPFLCFHS